MPKQIHPYEVLRRPIVTEKTTTMAALHKYVFEVAPGANKPQIKEAVQRAFGVTVEEVNTAMQRRKRKRTRSGRPGADPSSWKKAVVTLKPGDTIELFEGI